MAVQDRIFDLLPRGFALALKGADLKRGVSHRLAVTHPAGEPRGGTVVALPCRGVGKVARAAVPSNILARMTLAQDHGRAAAHAGRPLTACPYVAEIDPVLAAAWRTGWRDIAEAWHRRAPVAAPATTAPPAKPTEANAVRVVPIRTRLPYKDDEDV